MIGQNAPTDPVSEYAQRFAATEARIAELERQLSRGNGVISGTYTPTLTDAVVGTGGSPANTAEYVYDGGQAVGDSGLIAVDFLLRFGTSGQTFPTATTWTLPSGFNFKSADTNRPIGQASLTDDSTSANSRLGQVTAASVSTWRVRQGGYSAGFGGLTTTSPFTWASNDSINGQFVARVIRV